VGKFNKGRVMTTFRYFKMAKKKAKKKPKKKVAKKKKKR